MTNSTVLRCDENGIATLTLNRPDKLNSLNIDVFEDLEAHVQALESETGNVGVVIVRGAGTCFSAGHDLGDIAEGEIQPREHYQAEIIERLASLSQPVISAVHGHCYTGALELALAGDIILVASNARIADTHGKWGLTPVWGISQRLPRRIGQAKAAEMMLTCRTYTGDDALAMGLANQCFDVGQFDDLVLEFANSIVENSWFSNRINKQLLLETDGLALRHGLQHELENSPGLGPDAEARVSAFKQKASVK